ncbi:Ribosomal protein S18 acetylase RimI [Arthrobacter sp. ov407]|nr:Ribosomal protein S18 acetylase RimI [Arthrobacter sp. ov407]
MGDMAENIKIRVCLASDLRRLQTHEPPNANIALVFLNRQDAGDIIYATAWIGDEPRGGAVLDFQTDPDPELKHLFVYPAYRGQGVGRALCEWIEGQARQAGHRAIRLGVDPDNRAAVGLYESLGYIPNGDVETTNYNYIGAHGETQYATETTSIYRKCLTQS